MTCIWGEEIKLLVKGKKLWKSRENEKIIPIRFIRTVKKIKDAPLDFPSKEVNPYYKTHENSLDMIVSNIPCIKKFSNHVDTSVFSFLIL